VGILKRAEAPAQAEATVPPAVQRQLHQKDAQIRRTAARRRHYEEMANFGSYQIEDGVLNRLLEERFAICPVRRES
jgi:hypothetical protein